MTSNRAHLLSLVLVVAVSLLTVSAHAASSQRFDEGLLREFAPGNPVDLAWWDSPDPADRYSRPDEIVVLDAAAATVSRYSADGALLHRFGRPGVRPGELMNPQGLTVDLRGQIYVADTGNDRIQVFRADGSLVRIIGRGGSRLGELSGPRAVAIADLARGRDLVVVADTGNDRVQAFTAEGEPVGAAPLPRPVAIVTYGGWGVVVASDATPVLRNVYDFGRVEPFALLRGSRPAGRMEAPVDLAKYDDFYLADAGRREVVIYEKVYQGGLRHLRTVGGFPSAPRAVLDGRRREMPSFYVADGRRVVEVGLSVDSPLPAWNAYVDRIAAGDAEGALRCIHPQQRPIYRDIFAALGDALPSHAADMRRVEVSQLRQDEARLLILRDEEYQGKTMAIAYPVLMVRGAGGRWMVYDY